PCGVSSSRIATVPYAVPCSTPGNAKPIFRTVSNVTFLDMRHDKSINKVRPKRPKVINGQATTSKRRQDMEGGAHSQAGHAEEATAGEAGEEIKTVVQMEVIVRGLTRLPPASPSQPFHEEASRSNAGGRPPYGRPS